MSPPVERTSAPQGARPQIAPDPLAAVRRHVADRQPAEVASYLESLGPGSLSVAQGRELLRLVTSAGNMAAEDGAVPSLRRIAVFFPEPFGSRIQTDAQASPEGRQAFMTQVEVTTTALHGLFLSVSSDQSQDQVDSASGGTTSDPARARGLGLEPSREVDATTWGRRRREPKAWMIGVTHNSTDEYRAMGGASRLQRATLSRDPALPIVHPAGGPSYERTPEGLEALLAALEVPEGRTRTLLAQAMTAEENLEGTDELIDTVLRFAAAENGGERIERLVLSGHSFGDTVWGDSDEFEFRWFALIGNAFPNAAAQVQDVCVSGCSGGERLIEEFRSYFPQLNSFWAYRDTASSGVAAQRQLAAWERATRGEQTNFVAARRRVASTSRADNIITWTAARGYESTAVPAPMSESLEARQAQQATFFRYLSGELAVEGHHEGPLYEYQTTLRKIMTSPEFRRLPQTQQQALQRENEQVVRLRYWNYIRDNFAYVYEAPLSAAYEALGETMPSLSSCSRAEAIACVEQFTALTQDLSEQPPSPAIQEGLRLLEGLAQLDAEILSNRMITAPDPAALGRVASRVS